MEVAGYKQNQANAIKVDVGLFENIRQEIKLASGDYIDLKAYEPAMRFDSQQRGRRNKCASKGH